MVNIGGYWTSESLAQIANSPPSEYATLIVKGQSYRNWKTVRVKMEVGLVYSEFQFTAAEPIDITGSATPLPEWQIHVGASCLILLGGVPVISGYIEIRETAYDQENHGVMFYGRSSPKDAVDSSVHFPPDSSSQVMDGTFVDIMNRALQGTGIGLDAINIPGIVFKNFAINFGETPWHVAERLVRFLPGVRLSGDDLNPTMIAEKIDALPASGIEFLEGTNILAAHATIDITAQQGFFDARLQNSNSDDQAPSSVAFVRATLTDPTVTGTRWIAIAGEEPGDQQMAEGRVHQEHSFRSSEIIHADITVYGWFETSGALFAPYRQYVLRSPMLDIDRALWSRVVTFQQSEAGTTTTIQLCTVESLTGWLSADDPGANNPQGQYFGQGVTGNQYVNGGGNTTPPSPDASALNVAGGPNQASGV